ncbi:MAG: orotidine-5'-phosphate decarboxylase [Actinobacteria bacterium]|nr:orotidine-5'-phosphate decarboxylase [Actinomycetota bacterium]
MLRDRLALALDVDDLDRALQMLRRLKPYFGVAKVGLELFCSVGPKSVAAIQEEGFQVFADLKLYDIPTTVHHAARAMGKHGVSYLTVHGSGGPEMLKAAVAGLEEGSGKEPGNAVVLAVTVLTSEPVAGSELLVERVKAAQLGGCGGFVCAGPDLGLLRKIAPSMLAVVPGIRMAWSSKDDQRRVMGPQEALDAGADLLVIGRSVTQAQNWERAAEQLVASLHIQPGS